jgi:tetratricopeptide (TPR) repeat protein
MTSTPQALSDRRLFWLGALALVVAGVLAYSNSFQGIFLLDDEYTITDHSFIDDWSRAFEGPKGAPSSGRPLTSLSFVLNWKLSWWLGLEHGGRNPVVYHATNLIIHLGAGLTMMAFAANTLRRVPVFAPHALRLAWCMALLWTLHPINTSAVTYMSQRAESVMALFFLLAFWAAERGSRSERWDDWNALATLFACLAAFGKENAVALSLLVPLYDRAFLYNTWREARQKRWILWSLLCIPWALVLWIQFSDPRGGTVLLTYQVINPLTYLYTQANGIMMYLGKVLIPHGIILDYGWPVVVTFAQCAPAFLALAAMVGATIYACVRFPRVGFLGAWFFIILGPTSSVVPIITEILAEHRMYLPMMPVVTLLVAGTAWGLAKLNIPERVIGPAGLAACLGAAGFLGWRTHWQNQLYHDSVNMWEYNAKITPDNRRVWYNICVKSRVNRKDLKRAEEAGLQALRISPDYPDAHMQMAIVMKETKRLPEAEQYAMNAVRFEPDKGHH